MRGEYFKADRHDSVDDQYDRSIISSPSYSPQVNLAGQHDHAGHAQVKQADPAGISNKADHHGDYPRLSRYDPKRQTILSAYTPVRQADPLLSKLDLRAPFLSSEDFFQDDHQVAVSCAQGSSATATPRVVRQSNRR